MTAQSFQPLNGFFLTRFLLHCNRNAPERHFLTAKGQTPDKPGPAKPAIRAGFNRPGTPAEARSRWTYPLCPFARAERPLMDSSFRWNDDEVRWRKKGMTASGLWSSLGQPSMHWQDASRHPPPRKNARSQRAARVSGIALDGEAQVISRRLRTWLPACRPSCRRRTP